MSACFFCTVQKNKDQIIWENSLLFAIYDINPVSPGHTLVIPKRHVSSLVELSEKEWINYKLAIQEVTAINEKTNFKDIYNKLVNSNISKESVWFCRRALDNPKINNRPDAYNFGINEGKEAGRTIDHFHWHIIPRFKNDVIDPIGGVRNIIPGMGNYRILRNLK
ncbi:MAG: HIT family protein [Candidatus Levybacteria bacterium]|nr:HIT family protein [Candidatus Levybacteria bacterium]